MNMGRCRKEAFSVIGKEGSTDEGEGFIERLWERANGNFDQVEGLAKKDGEGNIVGVWGAMS
ncbi:MAG: AraC family transcriptional regulator, partial [Ruminococcus sp.]|nr:AraC family transcriptional regulator [Ruminococcus sp.]